MAGHQRSNIKRAQSSLALGGGEKRLSVDQFVLQDGRTFRTQDKHDDLTKACHELSNNPEALAEKVFGVNHAAAVTAREKND